MEAVRTYLGADEWRTMACGDSDNDLTMLRAADVSVAMGNGNDNAKAAATWVTTDIHNDGLLNAFAHFGLLD
jgi:hydroxymethylpyrimidine pyrophosphatase-like HAD family hydrolase